MAEAQNFGIRIGFWDILMETYKEKHIKMDLRTSKQCGEKRGCRFIEGH